MRIHQIATHGDAGATNGEFAPRRGPTYMCCNVCRFRGAKGARIAEIPSFVIADAHPAR